MIPCACSAMDPTKLRSEEAPATPRQRQPKVENTLSTLRNLGAVAGAMDTTTMSTTRAPAETTLAASEKAEANLTRKMEKLGAALEQNELVKNDERFSSIIDRLRPPSLTSNNTDGGTILGTVVEGSSSTIDANVLDLSRKVKRLEGMIQEKDAQLAEKESKVNELEEQVTSQKRAAEELAGEFRQHKRTAGNLENQFRVHERRAKEWKTTADAHSDRIDQLRRELEEERKAWAGFSTNDVRAHIITISGYTDDGSLRLSTNPMPSQFLVEEAFHHKDSLFPVEFDEYAMYKLILEIITIRRHGPIFTKLPQRFEGNLWKVWMALERLQDDEMRRRLAMPMFIMVRSLCKAYRVHEIDPTTMWVTSQIAHYLCRYGFKPESLTEEPRGLPCPMGDWSQLILEQRPNVPPPPVAQSLQVLQTRYPTGISRWDCFLKGEPRQLIYLGSQGSNPEEEIMLVTIRDDGKWNAWMGQRKACALFQLSLDLYLMADKLGGAGLAMILKFDEDYWLPHELRLRRAFPRTRTLNDADMQPLSSTRDWY